MYKISFLGRVHYLFAQHLLSWNEASFVHKLYGKKKCPKIRLPKEKDGQKNMRTKKPKIIIKCFSISN